MARFSPHGVNPFLDLGLAMTLGSTARWGAASSLPSSNPVPPEVGLLRSLFLLRVLRHLWTTPMDGTTKLKQISNARAHGQFIITPPIIAYGCCQVSTSRTMLSTSEWKHKDGNFGKYNYERLFNAVVELFKNPAGAWTIETLAWY
ncbi:hypothetical protein DFH07DRAFT_96597 [Mycena maculata]|uniref:Uncharacterized protein n=1 Tax=Mycena maculata TaxID=230809 RepID=A0AAD7I7W8_9AGAR|nr:hypothetical protein DFH07DRAFT_96597 [Mycena maculata]